MQEYWRARSLSLYYQAVLQVGAVVGDAAHSVVDIGSGETEFITWFEWIPEKVQVNRGFRDRQGPDGVDRVVADFMQWEPGRTFDLVLCMQVLEHVEDARGFCERLKRLGPRLLISVPYKWPQGSVPSHMHDPVDERKLKSWMQRVPNYSMRVREPFGPERLIAYYDLEGGPKTRIARRDAKTILARRLGR